MAKFYKVAKCVFYGRRTSKLHGQLFENGRSGYPGVNSC